MKTATKTRRHGILKDIRDLFKFTLDLSKKYQPENKVALRHFRTLRDEIAGLVGALPEARAKSLFAAPEEPRKGSSGSSNSSSPEGGASRRPIPGPRGPFAPVPSKEKHFRKAAKRKVPKKSRRAA